MSNRSIRRAEAAENKSKAANHELTAQPPKQSQKEANILLTNARRSNRAKQTSVTRILDPLIGTEEERRRQRVPSDGARRNLTGAFGEPGLLGDTSPRKISRDIRVSGNAKECAISCLFQENRRRGANPEQKTRSDPRRHVKLENDLNNQLPKKASEHVQAISRGLTKPTNTRGHSESDNSLTQSKEVCGLNSASVRRHGRNIDLQEKANRLFATTFNVVSRGSIDEDQNLHGRGTEKRNDSSEYETKGRYKRLTKAEILWGHPKDDFRERSISQPNKRQVQPNDNRRTHPSITKSYRVTNNASEQIASVSTGTFQLSLENNENKKVMASQRHSFECKFETSGKIADKSMAVAENKKCTTNKTYDVQSGIGDTNKRKTSKDGQNLRKKVDARILKVDDERAVLETQNPMPSRDRGLASNECGFKSLVQVYNLPVVTQKKDKKERKSDQSGSTDTRGYESPFDKNSQHANDYELTSSSPKRMSKNDGHEKGNSLRQGKRSDVQNHLKTKVNADEALKETRRSGFKDAAAKIPLPTDALDPSQERLSSLGPQKRTPIIATKGLGPVDDKEKQSKAQADGRELPNGERKRRLSTDKASDDKTLNDIPKNKTQGGLIKKPDKYWNTRFSSTAIPTLGGGINQFRRFSIEERSYIDGDPRRLSLQQSTTSDSSLLKKEAIDKAHATAAQGLRINAPAAKMQPAEAAYPPSRPGTTIAAPSTPSFAAPTTPGFAVAAAFRASLDQELPEPPDGTYEDRRGIRFCPAALVFRDVFEGERRALRFVLQNVSTRPVRVYVIEPSSVFFSLGEPRFNALMAPGMKHEDVLTLQQYSWRSGGSLNSSLHVMVDEVKEDYSIETQFAAPRLEVHPGQLDFGEVNLGAPVLVHFVLVRNAGRVGTNFAVDTGSEASELSVRPTRGRLLAFEETLLRCEFAPAVEGEFTRDIWVRDAKMACRIPVSVRVVCPKLTIQYPVEGSDGASVLLNFGSVYYGAQHRLVVAVNNASAEVCIFVVLAELPGNKLMTLRNARAQDPRMRVFLAHPDEGRISSFETRIFTFGFNPQLWVEEQAGRHGNEIRDFQLFVRILRVACIDYGITSEEEGKQRRNREDPPGASEDVDDARHRQRELQTSAVRVCLHGRAAVPVLRVTPRSLHLGRVPLGGSEQRVLRLDNDCAALPLWFRVGKPPPPGMRVEPREGLLPPQGAVEIAVHVTPRSFGTTRARLRLELLSSTQPLLAPPERALLGSRNVRVCYECPAESPAPAPKLSPGLSPLVNREVGLIGDGVPFCSDAPVPYMAMALGPKGRARRRDKMAAEARECLERKEEEKKRQMKKDMSKKPCDFECRKCPEPPSCMVPAVSELPTGSLETSGIVIEPPQAAQQRDDAVNAATGLETSAEDEAINKSAISLQSTRAATDIMSNAHIMDWEKCSCRAICGDETGEVQGKASHPSVTASQEAEDMVTSNAHLLDWEKCSCHAICENEMGEVKEAIEMEPHPSVAALLEAVESALDIVAPLQPVTRAQTESRMEGNDRLGSARADPLEEGEVNGMGEESETGEENEMGEVKEANEMASHPSVAALLEAVESALDIVAPLQPDTSFQSESRTEGNDPLGSAQADPLEVRTLFVNKHEKPLKRTQSCKVTVASTESLPLSASNDSSTCGIPAYGFRSGKAYDPTKSTCNVNITSDDTEKRVRNLMRVPPAASQPPSLPPPTTSSPSSSPPPSTLPQARVPPTTPQPFLSDDQEEPVLVRPPRRKHAERVVLSKSTATLVVAPLDEPKSACYLTLHEAMDGRQSEDADQPQERDVKQTSDGTSHAYRTPCGRSDDHRSDERRSPKSSSKKLRHRKAPRHWDRSQPKDRYSQHSSQRSAGTRPTTRRRRRVRGKGRDRDTDGEWDTTGVTSDTSSTVDSLDGVRREPVSPLIGTPLVLMDEAVEQSKAVAARGLQPLEMALSENLPEARDAVGNRCNEALRWARGEQLHPHCAFIAFPNDNAQRSIRPWPSNRLTRTIFLGLPRYSAPLDLDVQTEPLKLLDKAAQADGYRNCLRTYADHMRAIALAYKKPVPAPEYEVGNAKTYNLLDFRADLPETQLLPALPEPKKCQSRALVPLAPSQLINVRLKPPDIDFEKVGIGSRVKMPILVENDNLLVVKLNVDTPCSSITVKGNGVVYVPPRGRATFSISLESHTLGRYNGLLRYVVNDSHAFEVPVTAEVVMRTLELPVQELFFGLVHGIEEAWPKVVHVVPIQNPLQASCRFEWSAYDKTCYDVLPRSGTVPSMGCFACEVYFRVNSEAQSSNAELVLTSEGRRSLQLSCRMLAHTTGDHRHKPQQGSHTPALRAGFVRPELTLPLLPVQGRRRRFVLQLYNASNVETLFKVLENFDSPRSSYGFEGLNSASHLTKAPGSIDTTKEEAADIIWKVRPMQGTLRPRSVRQLHLTLRALSPGRMSFSVPVALGTDAFALSTAQAPGGAAKRRVERSVVVQSLSGEVAFPSVEINPKEIRLRRIPAGTQMALPIELRNVGKVEAVVEMPADCNREMGDEWTLSTRQDSLQPLEQPLLLLPRAPPARLYLHFRPQDMSSYDFYLPLQINGALGPQYPRASRMSRTRNIHADSFSANRNTPIQSLHFPCLHVEASVSRHVIEISETELTFYYNASDPSTAVTEQRFTVENLKTERVFIWMPLEPPGETPFKVSMHKTTKISRSSESVGTIGRKAIPETMTIRALRSKLAALGQTLNTGEGVETLNTGEVPRFITSSLPRESLNPFVAPSEEEEEESIITCTLEPRDVCPITLEYDPKEMGSFSAELPVYVGGIGNDTFPLVKLRLRAECRAPVVSLPVKELHLVACPINISTEAKLMLTVSDHVKDAEMTWKCEQMQAEGGSYATSCLKVMLQAKRVPRGPKPTQLPLILVFQSSRPLGLRARLVFSSGPPPGGASCALHVTAMADASILTTHAYFHSHEHYRGDKTLPPPPSRVTTTATLGRTRRSQRVRAIVRGATLYSDDECAEDDDTDADDEDDVSDHRPSKVRTIEESGLMEESFVMTGSSFDSMKSGQQQPGISRHSSEIGLGSKTSISSLSSIKSTATPDKSDDIIPRHRRQSRGDPEEATVDADMDSLLSSESSHGDEGDDGGAGEGHKGVFYAVDGPHNSFPAFPDSSDISEKAQYMRKVQQAVEEWLYDVAFQRHYCASIPDGFTQLFRTGSTCHSKKHSSDKKKKEKAGTCPFDICTAYLAITNLIGMSSRDLIKLNTPDMQEHESAWMYEDAESEFIIPGHTVEGGGEAVGPDVSDPPLHALAHIMFQRYALILHIMRCNGAVLPHVRPEYLLDYTMYKEIFLHEEPPASREKSGDSVEGAEESSPHLNRDSSSKAVGRDDHHQAKPLGPGFDSEEREEPLSQQRHRQLSRQAWLDLCLQMARAFWLPKIDEEHIRSMQAVRTSVMRVSYRVDLEWRSRQYNLASAALYSDQELTLLAWLNERFAHAREMVCPHSHSKRSSLLTAHKHDTTFESVHGRPPRRNVSNFVSHLSDGVVLAYVTLDVCPYLKDMLFDIYPKPINIEQAEHNAARVIQVWQTMHLAFTVSVRDIVQPVVVKMVLLVAFLYNSLPAQSGNATLRLSAPLVSQAQMPLTVVNPSHHALTYLAEFIGDTESFFSVLDGAKVPEGIGLDTASVPIKLPAKEHFDLKIQFHARSLQKQQCVLLLSGSIHANKFGRSLALYLEGQPSSLDVSETLHIKAPLYLPTKHILELPMPYIDKTFDFDAPGVIVPEFDLFLQHTPPSVSAPFAGCAWSQLRWHKELRRLFLNQDTVEALPPPPLHVVRKKFREKNRLSGYLNARPQTPGSYAKLSVTMCALTPRVRHFWIGCVSRTIGDFVVKVVTKPTKGGPLATLQFALPRGWRKEPCMCDGVFFGEGAFRMCPLLTEVQVPAANAALRRAVNTMFKKTLDDFDEPFWKQHLETSYGLQLMQGELEKGANLVDEYAHIFNTNVDYKITLKPEELCAPDIFNISDVGAEGTVALPLHVSNDAASATQYELLMVSADQREYRIYRLLGQASAEDLQQEQEEEERKRAQEERLTKQRLWSYGYKKKNNKKRKIRPKSNKKSKEKNPNAYLSSDQSDLISNASYKDNWNRTNYAPTGRSSIQNRQSEDHQVCMCWLRPK